MNNKCIAFKHTTMKKRSQNEQSQKINPLHSSYNKEKNGTLSPTNQENNEADHTHIHAQSDTFLFQYCTKSLHVRLHCEVICWPAWKVNVHCISCITH
uniref:Uncharacterized protein n=1 Tax=Rhipicephalus appendiculatus TaxID=34631 RepID=A0A131YBP3_RHIAP